MFIYNKRKLFLNVFSVNSWDLYYATIFYVDSKKPFKKFVHQNNIKKKLQREIITSQALQWLLSKNEKTTSVSKDVEKLETLCIAGENVKWYRLWGKQYDGSQKMNHRITIQSSNSTSVLAQENWKQVLELIFVYPCY